MNLHHDCNRTKGSLCGTWNRGRSSKAGRLSQANRSTNQAPCRTDCTSFAPHLREANGASNLTQIPNHPCRIQVKVALSIFFGFLFSFSAFSAFDEPGFRFLHTPPSLTGFDILRIVPSQVLNQQGTRYGEAKKQKEWIGRQKRVDLIESERPSLAPRKRSSWRPMQSRLVANTDCTYQNCLGCHCSNWETVRRSQSRRLGKVETGPTNAPHQAPQKTHLDWLVSLMVSRESGFQLCSPSITFDLLEENWNSLILPFCASLGVSAINRDVNISKGWLCCIYKWSRDQWELVVLSWTTFKSVTKSVVIA